MAESVATPEPVVQLPEHKFRTTRLLRLSVFSFVVSALAVSIFLVAFRFIYNEMIVPAYNAIEPDPKPFIGGIFPPKDLAEYTTHFVLVFASILLIAFVFGRLIWDAAEGRVPPKRGAKNPK